MTRNQTCDREENTSKIELISQYELRLLNCTSCGKIGQNRGNNLCCPCLRNYKRKTKPSFYLGTCYSEMKRRTSKFDPQRPNYLGKKLCTREEFIEKFETDENFLSHFANWQKNNYLRRFAPSIDRIDNYGDYVLENMQFISHLENTKKSNNDNRNNFYTGKRDSNKKSVKNIDTGEIFESLSDASKLYNLDPKSLKASIVRENKCGGFRWEMIN